MRKSIYQQCIEAGLEIDSHESDLYVIITPKSTELIDNYEFKNNVTTFVCQANGTKWYDIPFGYDPFYK